MPKREPPTPPVTIECVTDPARMEALTDAWDALAERSPGAHVFQSHAWVAAWMQHSPEGAPRVFIARRGERLTAAIPLCLHRAGLGPLGVRTLRMALDNADFCDGLADPDVPEDALSLWEHIMGRRDWHLVDLHYVRPDAHLSRLAARVPKGALLDRRKQDIAPYLDLSGDWRERVSKSQRSDWQRRRRRLEDQGTLRLERAQSPEEVDALLDEFAGLHVDRWRGKGETSTYGFAKFREFLRDACHRLLAAGRLRLYRLSLDGRTVSIGIYNLFGRHLLPYAYTFQPEFARSCPVHLLIMSVIEEVTAAGLADQHDFGRGDEEYKLRWAEQSLPLDRIVIARRGVMGWAALTWAVTLKPALWRNQRLHALVREVRTRLLRREA